MIFQFHVTLRDSELFNRQLLHSRGVALMDEPGGRGKGAEAPGRAMESHGDGGNMGETLIFSWRKIGKIEMVEDLLQIKNIETRFQMKIDDADRPVRIGLKSGLVHVGP